MNCWYDENGNLTTLKRYTSNANVLDNLTYNYRPYTNIDTLISNSSGSSAAYTYDAIGTFNSTPSPGQIFYII